MSTPNSQLGFVALISILIVSAVLLATTLGLAQFGIANRFFILHLEQKANSKQLAEACIQIARIQAYNDPVRTITTPVPIEIAGGTCTIVSMTPQGELMTVQASASVGNATTNLSVIVDPNDGSFISFSEVISF